MKSIRSALAAACALAMSVSAAKAAMLEVVDGELRSATGVLVQGELYDVFFDPGTCFDLFTGCDELSDLVFKSEEAALAASQALLDQVFLDGPLGDFDLDPELTFGITRDAGGSPLTPYVLSMGAPGVLAVGLQNSFREEFDGLATRAFRGQNQSLENINGSTWAVWSSAEATVVPAPAAGLLLLSALGGFAVFARRHGAHRRAPSA